LAARSRTGVSRGVVLVCWRGRSRRVAGGGRPVVKIDP
jgi:hypothetical protein